MANNDKPRPFKVGDIVQLKSGGPVMTIEYWVALLDVVGTTWFEENKVKRGRFGPKTLVLIEDQSN